MSQEKLDSPESILSSIFGHQDFRGRQREIISSILSNHHSLVLAPTGMGKSLCYQIPAIVLSQSSIDSQRTPLTLVISPLIALMQDQVAKLRHLGIDATYVNSALGKKQRESRYQGISDGEYSILYVTPERFRKPEFLEVVKQRNVVLLAVDEAHCISQWGHDFRPDYSRLEEIRAIIGDPITIALTATATPDVQEDIIAQLGLNKEEVRLYTEGIDRPNLKLEVSHVWSEDEKLDEIEQAYQTLKHSVGNGIVYFSLIRILERFSEELRERNIPHLVYHGDLSPDNRKKVQEHFMASQAKMILATNAFGLGIDKEDIRFVLHAEVPGSLESYYQEIGRAGRDGKEAFCRLLYSQSDLETQMEFIRWSHPDPLFFQRVYDFIENENESLNAFGLEWLRERLHARNRHDFRLETALNLLERYGAIEGYREQTPIRITGDLPKSVQDDDLFRRRIQAAQSKLLALVEYANHDGNRRRLIHEYFGVEN